MLSSLIDIRFDMLDSKSNGDWLSREFALEEAMIGSDTMKEPEEYEEKRERERDIVEVNLGLSLVNYTSTLSAVYIH